MWVISGWGMGMIGDGVGVGYCESRVFLRGRGMFLRLYTVPTAGTCCSRSGLFSVRSGLLSFFSQFGRIISGLRYIISRCIALQTV